jgi:hypothetical protein
MAKKRRKQLSEEDALAIVLKDHPEWRKQWDDGTLPDEIIGEDGEPMSPRMHIMVHTIVERQLATDEPNGVVAVATELEQLGLSHHDIRHVIGEAVACQLWYMNKEGCMFDEDWYMDDLRKTVDLNRQNRDAN